jgi:glycosyltransferase involved in cell wall biosynthesis
MAEHLSYQQVLVSRELGGAGLVALHMADFLQTRGLASSVWVPGDGPALRHAKRLGLAVREYDARGIWSRSRLRAGCANWKIGRALRRGGPGLVHVHAPAFYGALRVALRLSCLKRIVHVQIEEPEQLLRWAFQRPPELIITCARFLIDSVRRTLPAVYQERQRIVVVPNAVDTERFTPGDKREAKRRVGAPDGAPLLLMLANLAPHKGQETAIQAVAALKQRGVRVACWLAGVERSQEGNYTARLGQLIEELGVADRVRLLGYRNDAPELLRAADFFLLPSICEGLPLSILEAQATKVPVLAAPTAGIPEVVRDHETGFLISSQDAAGYAHCIERLLANPDLYHRVAEAAYTRVTRDYNWRSFCQQIWALYHDLSPGARPSKIVHRLAERT